MILGKSAAAGELSTAPPSPNQRQEKVRWNPAWAKFRPIEYATTSVLVAADVVIALAVKDPRAKWDGGIPSDDWFHDRLRAKTVEGRILAQQVSDHLLQVNFVVGLTEAPVAAAAHGQWDTAFQLSMLNAQAFALAGFIQLGSARLVGRVRPRATECEQTGSTEFPCNHGGPTLSFLSGHAMSSFVSAGLMCAHHGRLPLWGGGWADASACAAMIVSATTAGVLRVTADKHYTSDVMLGSLLGFAIGYGMPMLLHYGNHNEVPAKTAKWFVPLAPVPYVGAERGGVTWSALF